MIDANHLHKPLTYGKTARKDYFQNCAQEKKRQTKKMDKKQEYIDNGD